MPKEVRKARYFSRREELQDPELLSALISRRDYYTDAWWMVALAARLMRLTLERYVMPLPSRISALSGTQSHPLALPFTIAAGGQLPGSAASCAGYT
jgi:CRISPR system Cascade subunit CasD